MSKGIVLIAIGNQGYSYMAANLATSIKRFNEGISITLLADRFVDFLYPEDKARFDEIIRIPEESYTTKGKFDPARIKAHVYNWLPYEHNFYLDVDAIALQDIEPAMNLIIADGREILTTVVDRGSKDNEDINYSVWATTKKIVEFFEINLDNEIQAIQSSWIYIRKGAFAEQVYMWLSYYYSKGFPLEDLKEKWGGGLPDELFYSGVFSKFGLDVAYSGDFLLFADGRPQESNDEIRDRWPLLSLFGNATGRTKTPLRFWDLYDKLSKQYAKEMGGHHYKASVIRELKHSNKK